MVNFLKWRLEVGMYMMNMRLQFHHFWVKLFLGKKNIKITTHSLSVVGVIYAIYE